jgi:hypothetical protein
MFKYEGFEYTLDEVTQAASDKNLTVDEYVDQYGLETIEVTDEIQTTPTEGKTNGAVAEGATATPVTGPAPESTGLKSVDIFSESPDPKLRFIDFKIQQISWSTYTI